MYSFALNSDFYEFLHFLKAEIYKIIKIQSPWMCRNGSFGTSRVSKIDFTKNLNDRKILIFPHCEYSWQHWCFYFFTVSFLKIVYLRYVKQAQHAVSTKNSGMERIIKKSLKCCHFYHVSKLGKRENGFCALFPENCI